jgi:hypothetical protein
LIQEGILAEVERGGPLQVTTRAVPEGTGIFIDDVLAFRVLELDVNPEAGEVSAKIATQAAANLRTALAEIAEARNTGVMLTAVGYSLLATVLLIGALWLVLRLYRRVTRAFTRSLEQHSATWSGLDGHTHASIGDLSSSR